MPGTHSKDMQNSRGKGNDTDTLDAAVSQPLHEPIIAAQPAEPQQRRQHQYPNRHLDPNIDINLQQKRIRQPPQRYDAKQENGNEAHDRHARYLYKLTQPQTIICRYPKKQKELLF